MPEVLIRFQRIVGTGRVQGPEIEEGREPLYKWVVSSRPDVLAVYNALRSRLGMVKRRQFEEVLGLPDPGGTKFASDAAEDCAWAAGFFDGEGSVYLLRHRSHAGYFVLEAGITQSSWDGVPEVLERFQQIFGVGKIYGPYPGGHGHAPVYRWKAHRCKQIEAMIGRLTPDLGEVKREQAALGIGVVAGQLPLPRGNPAWGNRKTHCIHGHEYAKARLRPFRGRGKNTEPRRDSHQCLACVREYVRARRVALRTKNGG